MIVVPKWPDEGDDESLGSEERRKKTFLRRKKHFRQVHIEQFPLLDIPGAEPLPEFFPYDEVCRVEFDNKFVFIDPPEEIFITDTTFRDGQQARPPYTVEQIVDLL